MKKLDIHSIETERIDWDDTQVVDRIVRQYENFPKAFQKESIQNAWDARLDEGWKVEIYYHKESDGKIHLIIEDFGTTGMNDEKLYAFLSLWKPHKEHLDAGGQGQGKFVLMGASKEEIIIVESINEKKSYRCKFLQRGRKSKDNILIQDFFPKVKSLSHQGTKIWVYDINKDFLKTLKSEEFVDFIRESWWQILGSRFNAKILLFGKTIKLPELPPVKEEVILLKNKQLENFGTIKRLVLMFYERPIPKIFQGIRIQRANMMITKISFEVYEKDYRGRFSGYIEFDQNNLEKLLKDIEKTDHCGFINKSPWKEIKELLKNEAQKFVEKIIPSKEEQKTINIRNLSQIIQRANQIISDYCPEISGKGTFFPPIVRPPEPPLRIKYLSVNKKEVKYGDTVKPYCSILNEALENKKVSLYVELKRDGEKVSEEVYKLSLIAHQLKPIRISEINLNKENFLKGKYIIRATLKDNRHDLDIKSTSFYLETKREPAKKGFIKKVELYHGIEEPLRYKSLERGIIKCNTAHRDFENIWNSFLKNPNILNKQIGFYIIKICLDEALNESLKLKMGDSQIISDFEKFEKIVKEISENKDKMYYDVYI